MVTICRRFFLIILYYKTINKDLKATNSKKLAKELQDQGLVTNVQKLIITVYQNEVSFL